MDVRDIMTRLIVTARMDDTVGIALRKLETEDIRHLPIVDEERLIGMISDRDLREYRLPLIQRFEDPDFARGLLDTPLSSVMEDRVVSVDVGATVDETIDVMLEHGVGAVPVVERHGDDLVGIVSYVDVLRAIRAAAA